MKTEELIEWLSLWKIVLTKDGWDNLQEGVLQEIIIRLKELGMLQEKYKELTTVVHKVFELLHE